MIMTTFDFSQKTRTAMARNLSRFLAGVGLEIQHTQANKAIAVMLGMDEHALASAIKHGATAEMDAEWTPAPAANNCSVAGCGKTAAVEVRLFDIYLGYDPEVFDKRDFTCPFLCADHLAENEATAVGKREPRGFVQYRYTNRDKAQGFSTYRKLE
jgi:hypothetical protein